jgi:hypothetical protein
MLLARFKNAAGNPLPTKRTFGNVLAQHFVREELLLQERGPRRATPGDN